MLIDEKFSSRKKNILKQLKHVINNQETDSDITPLLTELNKKEGYVTTSSCSGRMILIEIPPKSKKKEARIIWKKHTLITFSELKEAITGIKSEKPIWFMTQPIILHVLVKDLEHAKKIILAARKAGFKKVGVLSLSGKIVVQIEGHHFISLKIMDKGNLLVTDYYLKDLVKEANNKLHEIKRFLERLIEEIKKL